MVTVTDPDPEAKKAHEAGPYPAIPQLGSQLATDR